MVIETGLSDFHKMSFAVTKIYYSKQNHTFIPYHKLEDLNNKGFLKELKTIYWKSFWEEIAPFEALR